MKIYLLKMLFGFKLKGKTVSADQMLVWRRGILCLWVLLFFLK